MNNNIKVRQAELDTHTNIYTSAKKLTNVMVASNSACLNLLKSIPNPLK
jgi:hypothetical protein